MESNLKKIFKGLDKDIVANLKEQLMVLWTHNSTAIEGNTLTLGETSFVIREGLTISGKSVKDHEEVVGYFKATTLLEDIVKENIDEEKIFKIHQIVMTNAAIDIYKPVGAWKTEPNGTYVQTGENIQWVEFPEPKAIPGLMKKWIDLFNRTKVPDTIGDAVKTYSLLHVSFTKIHPFFDGNGRVARLLANIPVLRGGMPPVTINVATRKKYIDLLSGFSISEDFFLEGDLKLFEEFVDENYKEVFKLIEQARNQQKKRNLIER